MATKIACIREAANTSTGVQILDAPSGWGTANYAFVVCGRTDADSAGATGTDGISMCVGMTDGTRQGVGAFASKHNADPADAWSKGNTSRVILLLNPDDGTVLADATFVAFPADGFRINWTTAPPAGYFVMVWLVQCRNAYVSTCVAEAGAVTAPGFRPNAWIGHMNGSGGHSFNDTLETEGAWAALGFATALPSLRQCGVSWSSVSGGSAPDNLSRPECTARDDAVCQWDSGANAFTGRFAITSFDSGGFTINGVGTPDATPYILYAALEFDGNTPAWCGIITSPTGATPQATAYRGMGLTPIAALHAACFANSTNSVESDGDAATFSVSMHDGTSQFAMAVSEEDAQTPTDNQTLAEQKAIRIPTGTSTQGPRGEHQSFDADGMTINWTFVSNAERRIATLAIGRPRRPDRVRREAM